MSVLRRAQQWGTYAVQWHLYDIKWQDPFISAKILANYLKGLRKPIWFHYNKCGDHVVVINSNDIALRGDEWTRRVYYHHTTMAKGASWTLAHKLHALDKTMIVKKALYSALGNNVARRYHMQRLHVYPDENVPEEIMANVTNQIRQHRIMPTRLDHIPQEEIDKFPQLVILPKDYIKE